MPERLGDDARIRAIIEQTIKSVRTLEGSHVDFVTRDELAREMASLESRLETKIENAILQMRNWVLTGIIATTLIFGGGFIAMMSKFDRVSEAVTDMAASLDTRRQWIAESDERDRTQDDALRSLKPGYRPVPFETVPK